jgi:hypothetical protein
MGNFQDSRFLGLSPRAIGLGIVAVGVVVGLFFIPETVKFLFDGKPRTGKEKVVASKQAPQSQKRAARDDAKAALSPNALTAINASTQRSAAEKDTAEKSAAPVKTSKRGADGEEAKGQGGLFSGWNFQVKANPGSRPAEAPPGLTLERLQTKDGVAFIKRGRSSIGKFLRSEQLEGAVAADGMQPLLSELDAIVAGGSKNASAEDLSGRLRQAHSTALRGLRAAGADRGVLLRWLELPLIQLIDQQSGMKAQQKLQAAFSPGLILSDLSIRERGVRDSRVGMPEYRAGFLVSGTDIERVVVYSNGRILRTVRISKARSREPRSIRIQGASQGVISVVVHDLYGGRPFSKSYSFYPKATVFRQDDQGVYQIGFLPGSARNSLDKFFFVGGSGRPTNRDPVISQF